MNLTDLRLKFEIKWEIFLFRMKLHSSQELRDNLFSLLLKRGWRDGGTQCTNGTIEDSLKIVEDEYQNWQKVKQ